MPTARPLGALLVHPALRQHHTGLNQEMPFLQWYMLGVSALSLKRAPLLPGGAAERPGQRHRSEGSEVSVQWGGEPRMPAELPGTW